MNTYRKLGLAAATAALSALAGCWGGSGGDAPVATPAANEVPDSAGAGTAAFVSYILSLSANDESSPPLVVKDSFAVPADETSEPTPLT